MKQIVFAKCDTINVEGNKEIAFGLNDGLPWGHLKQDMLNFASRTKDAAVVMGAKTFSTLSKPLKNRLNIVVVKGDREYPTTKEGYLADYYIQNEDFEILISKGDCLAVSPMLNTNIPSLMRLRDSKWKDISIIGGKGLLERALGFVDRVVISSINKRHYAPSDVRLNPMMIDYIKGLTLIESHYWRIDELTELTESVYETPRT